MFRDDLKKVLSRETIFFGVFCLRMYIISAVLRGGVSVAELMCYQCYPFRLKTQACYKSVALFYRWCSLRSAGSGVTAAAGF